MNSFKARAGNGAGGEWTTPSILPWLRVAAFRPATDGKVLALVPGPGSPALKGKRGINGTSGLAVWDAAKFCAKLADAQRRMTAAYTVTNRKFDDLFNQAGLALWEDPTPQVNAVALTSNAVVSAEAATSAKHGSVVLAGWRVAARDRTTGNLLWSVPLPGEPSFAGLAIDHVGRAIVTLRDGAVAVSARPRANDFQVAWRNRDESTSFHNRGLALNSIQERHGKRPPPPSLHVDSCCRMLLVGIAVLCTEQETVCAW